MGVVKGMKPATLLKLFTWRRKGRGSSFFVGGSTRLDGGMGGCGRRRKNLLKTYYKKSYFYVVLDPTGVKRAGNYELRIGIECHAWQRDGDWGLGGVTNHF